MKTNSLVVAMLLGIGVCIDTRAISVSGLYNTGVDDSGQVIPLHAAELHWVVQGPVDTVYRVPIVYHSPGHQAWVTPPEGSAWIGPNPTESTWPHDPPGLYTYKLEFIVDLGGIDPQTLTLVGRWASDNWSEIWFNGEDTGYARDLWGFVDLQWFSIQGGFLDGVNTLVVKVLNQEWGGNPTGLLVSDLQIIQGGLPIPPPGTSVPDAGGTFGLLLAGIGAVVAVRRARCRGNSQKLQTQPWQSGEKRVSSKKTKTLSR
ncbi:hypothetical protein [Limisphaera sp. VF-2]|uniref:hypothetical protein n=1 Tax=Limisphaera sp. VF-2 TaxID=3400418 RepID=UPI0017542664|nr:hypothetical protein [Limisphaera sp.]